MPYCTLGLAAAAAADAAGDVPLEPAGDLESPLLLTPDVEVPPNLAMSASFLRLPTSSLALARHCLRRSSVAQVSFKRNQVTWPGIFSEVKL